MKSLLAFLLCFSPFLYMEVDGAPNGTESREEETTKPQQQIPQVEPPGNVTAESLKEKLKTAKETMQNMMAIAEDWVNRLEEKEERNETHENDTGIAFRSDLHREILTNRELMKELLNVSHWREHGKTSVQDSQSSTESPLQSKYHHRSSKRCDSLVPWLRKMARGVDIARMDLLPLDFTGPDGFKRPLFDFTCERGSTIIVNNTEFQLPDQVWEVTRIPGGWLSPSVQLFKSYQDVRRSMALQVEYEPESSDLFKLAFSASRSYERMQHIIANKSHYIKEVSSFETAFQVDLIPSWVLHLSRLTAVFVDSRLPKSFTEDPGAYEEFIANFGTHYFKSAKFGGLIKLLLETHSDYFENKSDEEMKAQALAFFLKILPWKISQSDSDAQGKANRFTGYGYDPHNQQVTKRFQEMTMRFEQMTKTISQFPGAKIEHTKNKVGSVVCSELAEEMSVVLHVGTNDTPKFGSELMGRLRQAIRTCREVRPGLRVAGFMEECIPKKSMKSVRQPVWFTSKIKALIRDERQKWDTYKRKRDRKDYDEYRRYTRTLKWEIRSARQGVEERLASDAKTKSLSPKAFNRYYGGDMNEISSKAFRDWQSTISESPWLISGELTPISSLIQDKNKSASMEKAVKNHLLRAYVGELARIVEAVPSRWTFGLSQLKSLMGRIATFQSTRILDEEKVEQLGADVKAQVEFPSWFTQWTQLCFRWESGGENTCGTGAEAQQLCANPGNMTDVYMDVTQNGEDCKMSWGIQSVFEPDWFNEVQLCFRWSKCRDSTSWKACGSDIDPPLCATVNTWTTFYHDTTNSRMSWMLIVPSTAPVWLHNVKIYNASDWVLSSPTPPEMARATGSSVRRPNQERHQRQGPLLVIPSRDGVCIGGTQEIEFSSPPIFLATPLYTKVKRGGQRPNLSATNASTISGGDDKLGTLSLASCLEGMKNVVPCRHRHLWRGRRTKGPVAGATWWDASTEQTSPQSPTFKLEILEGITCSDTESTGRKEAKERRRNREIAKRRGKSAKLLQALLQLIFACGCEAWTFEAADARRHGGSSNESFKRRGRMEGQASGARGGLHREESSDARVLRAEGGDVVFCRDLSYRERQRKAEKDRHGKSTSETGWARPSPVEARRKAADLGRRGFLRPAVDPNGEGRQNAIRGSPVFRQRESDRPEMFRELLGALLLMAAASHAQTPQRCTYTLPFLSKMSRGVDVTQLDLTPMDTTGRDGFRQPIFNFTCDKGYRVNYAMGWGGGLESPDQVWGLTPSTGEWLPSRVRLYTSYQDAKAWMALAVGGDPTLATYGFSAGDSYGRMQDSLLNGSRFVQEVTSFYSAVSVDLIPQSSTVPGLLLDNFVKAAIAALPDSYSNNPGPYEDFIANFGTHYFKHADFGGLVKLVLETRSEYFLNKTEQEAKRQAEAAFTKLLQDNGSQLAQPIQSAQPVDRRFEEMTTKTAGYFGVNSSVQPSGDVQYWLAVPWLISGELASISGLITDANKRSSMQDAVWNHLLQAYVDELMRIVMAVPARWSFGLSKLKSLVDRTATLQNTRILTKATVDALATDVATQVDVPAWFQRWTQLCFRWDAAGDPSQCGGGVGQQLCAKPGRMTDFYKDDTYKDEKGCKMSWSIQSLFEPSWFDDVQLCFRWSSDGDARQCGGDVDPTLCATVNSWTVVYRDMTDKRAGGCRMSWMLSVPNYSPVWILNAKMCMSWYSDGDATQCGGLSPGNYTCAIANEWTPYYLDNTDDRKGGCFLSWGLRVD
ncbi:unnamed protein product [Darwinula stevensoni]|uniref:MACPF domain-containing protein n=1 Tax=Darwinula stevensoni TaxID=69355 RepID=A0A7R9FPP9_9CRUS|nr:unnamed protein product [Darwinula stevensoni]CAG0897906.1 unnamed protein product [Darwinula stevensoni]